MTCVCVWGGVFGRVCVCVCVGVCWVDTRDEKSGVRVLQCVVVRCSVLQCVAVCYSVLRCAAVYCYVLQ